MKAQASDHPVQERDASGNGTAQASGVAMDRGKTFLAEGVVTKIATLAAERVPGVYQIGAAGLRGAVSRLAGRSGVESEVGMRQAAVTLDIIVEYGHPIGTVTRELRRAVVDMVRQMADREVISVDVNVVDVHLAVPEPPRRVLE